MIGTDRWVRPEAVLPDRALYFPTFSPFVIVNKISLSLSPEGRVYGRRLVFVSVRTIKRHHHHHLSLSLARSLWLSGFGSPPGTAGAPASAPTADSFTYVFLGMMNDQSSETQNPEEACLKSLSVPESAIYRDEIKNPMVIMIRFCVFNNQCKASAIISRAVSSIKRLLLAALIAAGSLYWPPHSRRHCAP